MIYRETAPAEILRPFVESYWRFQAEADDPLSFAHTIVPDGAFSLFRLDWNGHGFVGLTGPAPRAHQTTAGRGMTCFGVRLRPGALKPLLGLEPARFAGRFAEPAEIPPPLADLMTAAALAGDWEACVRQLDVGLLARVGEPVDPVVARTAARLGEAFDGARIGDLAAAESLTPRHLRRRFLAAAGIAPKTYAQARRMREACLLMLDRAGSWGEVAVGAGFADQPHLIREFAHKLRMRPRDAEAYLGRIRHVFAAEAGVSHSFNTPGERTA